MENNVLVSLYRLLLSLYPATFQEQLGAEMVSVFAESAAEARRQGGAALARLILRELLHLPGNLLLAYSNSWQQLQPAVANAPGWPWIIGWTSLSVAALPLAWFLMAPFSVLFLFLFDMIPGPAVAPETGTIVGVVTAVGLVSGFGQWLLLRPHLPGAGWWLPLTVAGWLAGGALLFVAVSVLDGQLLIPATVLLLPAAGVGVAQWLLLRRLLPGSGWWLPVTLVAAGTVLLAGRSFGSIAELLAFLTLPFLITGAFLWLLLQRAPAPSLAAGPAIKRSQVWRASSTRRGRASLLLLALLVLVPLAVGGPWVYAVARLEMAKREGIYASPEEAVRTRAAAVEGVQVEKVNMVYAGPNDPDGELPHVWFAGGSVSYDRPDPFTGRRYLSMGSFYIRVEEGWVRVPEGAFPTLVGRLMAIYHLEGIGHDAPPTTGR